MRGLTLADPALVGAAAGFSPLSLSPALWLDASDAATITSSGGKVSQWANKGTLGAFTQSTSTYQPGTGTDTLNGLNVITFTADYMTSADAASAYKAFHDGTDYILASVIKFGSSSNPNNFYVLLDNCSTGSASVGMSVFYDDRASVPRNDRVAHFVARGVTASFAVNNVSNDNAMSANAWHTLTLSADPDNATPANRSTITVDTGSAIANNGAGGTPSPSNPSFTMLLGSLNTAATSFPMTGMIAELIMLSGTNATTANLQLLVSYLRAKWGL